jgi:hypothetical protein
MSTTSASAPSAQPVNQEINASALIQALLRIAKSFEAERLSPDFMDFTLAIQNSPEAAEALEDLLWCGGSDDDHEGTCRQACGVGVIAGMLYAQITGATVAVPELSEFTPEVAPIA